MPMMMRGIPAPRAKQMYIITDTKREAEAAGVPFGRIVDPFGDPVIRAFSLFPYLAEQGKDVDFASAYLRGAWAEGIDITTDDGIRIIAESVGINWHDAEKHLGSSQWQAVLEHNVNDMLNAGLWGVPSFRVTGGNNAEPFCCWGQDRLWRVETEISLRANSE
jgi:2-hydroxychromene-2-carboxylate isomerase